MVENLPGLEAAVASAPLLVGIRLAVVESRPVLRQNSLAAVVAAEILLAAESRHLPQSRLAAEAGEAAVSRPYLAPSPRAEQ